MRRAALVAALVSIAGGARAQTNAGFSIARYEPTPAGEWSFWVDHPWYTRGVEFLAVGLTLDYAHDPLVFGVRSGGAFTQTQAVVEHALLGHVDVAASVHGRLTLSFSLPVVLLERGTGASGVAPLGAVAVGDPRVGAMVRVVGQPLGDAFSLHVGAQMWIPIGANDRHGGDASIRLLPKVVLGGLTHHLLWSFSGGFLYRSDAAIGSLPAGAGNTVGSELQLGAALAYADLARRFAVGPEAVLASVVVHGHAFERDFTSLELLLGLQYNIVRQVQLGLAGGIGLLTEPGTPDARGLFRLAYAPLRTSQGRERARTSDRDHDGIDDPHDACPDVKGLPSSDPDQNGCPPPLTDRDHDGVLDIEDICPDEPRGPHPDPKRPGCPEPDRDGDGVLDSVDQCPTEPAGSRPDPARPGCPVHDRDGDQVPDEVDACPDEPGAPDPDPKKNGCPGLVLIKEGKIVILEPVYFATNKDVILQRSFPVLQAVANALIAESSIARISIEGHTDARGKPARNLDLSQRRAQSVLRWLVEHGITDERLEAHGFGQSQPIMSNRTASGRAANRRVEFRIVETPPAPSSDPHPN